jgi:uncharacterized membrane protein
LTLDFHFLIMCILFSSFYYFSFLLYFISLAQDLFPVSYNMSLVLSNFIILSLTTSYLLPMESTPFVLWLFYFLY